MKKTISLVLVFGLCGIVSAYEYHVSWIHGEIEPDFSIVPDNPTTEDLIHFSMPTDIYANQWVAELNLGGIPTLSIDLADKTIKLRIQGPPPEGPIPTLWDPVCGLEGSFGPLEEGSWLFDYYLPGVIWFHEINVIPPFPHHENGPVKFKATVTAHEDHNVSSVCYGDYFVPVTIDQVIEDSGNLLAGRTSVEVCYDIPLGLHFGDKVGVYGWYYGGVCPLQYCGRVVAHYIKPLPDLYDDGESYRRFSPRTVEGGQPFEISCDIRNGENMNTGRFSGRFNVEFYALEDTDLSRNVHYIGKETVLNISAGSYVTCEWSGDFPTDIPPGQYYVGWIIDADGEVDESDETNNTAYKKGYKLTVRPHCEGRLHGWGRNDYGQTAVPTGNDFIAIAAGAVHSLALKSDGSIVGWGRNQYGQATPPEGNDFVAIAAGDYHGLSLRADGSIAAWGRNNFGQASPPAGNDFIAIAAGAVHSLALNSDGSIIGWGHDQYGQATPLIGNDFVDIAAAANHSFALKSGGVIVAWGSNSWGQATPPTGNDFVAIAAGATHGLALKSDGSIIGWGDNRFHQGTPPAGNDFVDIAAGSHHGLALRSDGSIIGWGGNYDGQANAPVGKDFVAIAAAGSYSLAIEGDVWSSPVTASLSEAVDTDLSFTTGGSATWFSQTSTSYYDSDAAQSGDISHNQNSWMQTTVSGTGTVKFYWKVSSEEEYDCLEFYIDGSLEDQISGLEDYWVQKTYTISTSGSHVLEWRYMKDGATSYGSDCGWVDKVEWVTIP